MVCRVGGAKPEAEENVGLRSRLDGRERCVVFFAFLWLRGDAGGAVARGLE